MTQLQTDKTFPPSAIRPQPVEWRHRLWFVLRLIFVAAIALLIVSKVDVGTFLRQIQQINVGLVLLGFVISLIAMVIAAARWKILIDRVLVGTRLRSLIAFNLVGQFYSQFLPGSITGDVVKGIYLARTHTDKAGIISSTLLERLIGIVSNGLIGVGVLMTNGLVLHALGMSTSVPPILLVLVALGLPVGYAVFQLLGRWESRFPVSLASAYRTIHSFLAQPVVILKAVTVSVVFFLVWAVAIWCLALSVGLNTLNFPTILLILAAVNFAQVIPISLNGWGIREGVLVVLLSAYGVPSERALLLSLLIAVTNLIIALIGGLLVLADYRDIRKAVAD